MEKRKLIIGGAILGTVVIIAMIIIFFLFLGEKEPQEKIVTAKASQAPGRDDLLPYKKPKNASKITGLACDNFDKRPFAIMFTGDKQSRRYFSNLSQADFVLEMPHRPMHGQPRLMGVFQCNTPEIVGPMRSGRTDHISVAGSLDAIYVPWGGSSVGKNLLKKGAIDHIDCNGEIAPTGKYACFRRQGPMNTMESASSSVPDLIKRAEEVGYRKEAQIEGFSHQGELPQERRPAYGKIRVKFQDPYEVEYLYDPETNSYLRSLDGKKDLDYETGQQYAPKNIITIVTKKDTFRTDINYASQGLQDPWSGINAAYLERDNGQYPNMQLGDPWFDTKFEGEAEMFFNGQRTKGTWKREKGLENGFQFFDEEGREVYFAPGQIWMHVLGHARSVSYENEEEYQERLEDEQGL